MGKRLSEWVIFGSLFLLFSFLLFGLPLGWVTLHIGTRAGSFGGLVQTFALVALYGLGIHFLLAWPLFRFVMPRGQRTKSGRWKRTLVGSTLVGLPLLSFANYLQVGSGLFDLWDLVSMVIPPVLIGWVWFECSSKEWVFSWFCALATAIPMFFLQDQLAPYSVWIGYAAQSSDLYTLRNLCPLLAVGWAMYYLWKYPSDHLELD